MQCVCGMYEVLERGVCGMYEVCMVHTYREGVYTMCSVCVWGYYT